MSTLIYSPGVRVVIHTARYGLIDVSDDLQHGTLTRTENAVSKFSFSLINHRRKYDMAFAPNDRISVQFKRISWLQQLAGYLDEVPYFSVYPKSVALTASCSLKAAQFRLWDAGAPASVQLMNDATVGVDPNATDGAMKQRIMALLTKVGGWEQGRIHIGALPQKWFDSVNKLYETVQGKLEVPSADLGSMATISGDSIGGATSVPSTLPMTGQLPATSGRCTEFGGPGQNTATGGFELTGEPGLSPTNVWYCAMRWPYKTIINGKVEWNPANTQAQRNAAKDWWRNRKILVINPQNNKAVVLRAADWGPNSDKTTAVIDISPEALEDALGFNANPRGSNSGNVQIRFAPDNALLGPYKGTVPSTNTDWHSLDYHPSTQTDLPSDYTIPASVVGDRSVHATSFAWGGFKNGEIPVTALRRSTVGVSLHPIAAESMDAMAAAAKKAGVTLKASDGYRNLATQQAIFDPGPPPHKKGTKNTPVAQPGSSNHGWGMAADMNFGSGGGLAWMRDNAYKFGWVNPPVLKSSEPWHWEFWAGLKYVDLPVSGDGSAVGGGLGTTTGPNGQPILNTIDWTEKTDLESSILAGPRVLMNDTPLLDTVHTLVLSSLRSYQSTPNGDFAAWFPDYFGIYGTAGKIVVQDIELAGDGFAIQWSDARMKTHQFTAGSPVGGGVDSLGDFADAQRLLNKTQTMGVATVEFPEILQSLLNAGAEDMKSGWLNADAILSRFGARVNFTPMGTISSPEAEFWFACHLFQKNWAEQFFSSVNLTWMPEVYPGMLLQIPSYKFQAYVEEVSHHFDFSEGAQAWSTEARIIAPSATDGSGLYGMVRGNA